MGSRKQSARAKQRASFESSFSVDAFSLDNAFAHEDARREKKQAERESHLRYKACERKKRYPNKMDAQEALEACKRHGSRDLHIYQCPYCKGYHLTHKPTK